MSVHPTPACHPEPCEGSKVTCVVDFVCANPLGCFARLSMTDFGHSTRSAYPMLATRYSLLATATTP